jgi:pimeloyl-ACP methyl ester carboxylesterase
MIKPGHHHRRLDERRADRPPPEGERDDVDARIAADERRDRLCVGPGDVVGDSDPDAVAAHVALFGVTGLPDTTTPVACPVLAIAGEQDAPPMRSGAVLEALTPLCPSLTVAPLGDVGHYPMQEAPPLFAALVQRFLR